MSKGQHSGGKGKERYRLWKLVRATSRSYYGKLGGELGNASSGYRGGTAQCQFRLGELSTFNIN